MVIPPTDSQWEAIRACEEHVLVEAGAGTGKTATVVARILYLLGVEVRGQRREKPITLADIVAITFTRQAAADLKRDLRKALRAAGRRADAYEVDQARIGTIHGFCSDIVNEHSLRSGRSPIVGVLEEGEALAWAEESARDQLLYALEARDIPGLDALLAAWDVTTVEGWVLRLMQKPDLLARADLEEHAPEEAALIELSRGALARLEARLEVERTIDYDRMIAWTRDLLRDETDIRAAMQRRTHTIIIDEFQDTDPVQREIAYLLAEPGSGRTDTPRLMLVGDPKQSIYRFRGADVTVWSGVRRDFEEGGWGRVLRLRDNFRSVPSILAFVEVTAGEWLNTPVAGTGVLDDYEVAFHPVDATRTDPDAPAIEFLVIAPDERGKSLNKEPRLAVESAGIARRLRELHDQEGIAWRDMALLLRTWSNLDAFATALRAEGIPVYALRDDDFLETREVIDLIVALRAIRDPGDDLAVLGFLRSPFVSVRDDTLLALAAPGARRPYLKYLEPGSLPESERLVGAQSLLDDLCKLRDRMPAAELLDELIHRTGYLAHLSLRGETGAQAALNVRRFLQMLDEMEESTVGRVLRAIDERRARRDRVPQARLHGEQDDVVLITSIHMAKGLDWRVVVVGDVATSPGQNNEPLQIGRDRIALKQTGSSGEEPSPRWQMLRSAIDFEEAAEAKRVAYVAVTRPKDRLIIAGVPRPLMQPKFRAAIAADFGAALPALGSVPSGETITFAGVDGVVRRALVRVLEQEPAEAEDAIAVDAQSPVPEVGAGNVRGGEAAPDGLHEPAPEFTLPGDPIPVPLGLTRHSATELLSFSRCQRRHRFKYVLGIREPEVEVRGETPLIDAVTRGQIVHDVLERYEEDEALESLLEDAIGRWDDDAPGPESPLGRTYRSELAEEIERVLALPEYATLANTPGARRELQFLHVLEDGTAMQGAIDLASPSPEGAVLVDVKTSSIRADEAERKAADYSAQRDVYVAAAEAITGRRPAAFRFVFSRPGVSFTTRIDAVEAAAAADRIQRSLAVMATAPDSLAVSPRECYFCGYRRVGLCEGVARPHDSQPELPLEPVPPAT